MLNEFLLTEPLRLMEKRFHGSTHFESGREAVVDHAFRPAPIVSICADGGQGTVALLQAA